MKSKFFLALVTLVLMLSFNSVAISFAQDSSGRTEVNKDIPTPDLSVPEIPKPLPSVPGINGVPVASPIPQDTLKTLQRIDNLNKLQKTLDTLKTLEALDKIQNVGMITVTLTNSESFKELTVGVTAILMEEDLSENVALLQKNLDTLRENIEADLTVLTDKELTWEQESRNVLKSVRKKINALVGKEFIADLFYSQFELTKK